MNNKYTQSNCFYFFFSLLLCCLVSFRVGCETGCHPIFYWRAPGGLEAEVKESYTPDNGNKSICSYNGVCVCVNSLKQTKGSGVSYYPEYSPRPPSRTLVVSNTVSIIMLHNDTHVFTCVWNKPWRRLRSVNQELCHQTSVHPEVGRFHKVLSLNSYVRRVWRTSHTDLVSVCVCVSDTSRGETARAGGEFFRLNVAWQLSKVPSRWITATARLPPETPNKSFPPLPLRVILPLFSPSILINLTIAPNLSSLLFPCPSYLLSTSLHSLISSSLVSCPPTWS